MTGKVLTVAQQKGGSGKTTVAANLAVALLCRGKSVALLDTDPQGSLGRWFMTRRERGDPGLEFSTASAWGVSYECEKLKKHADYVIIDTPPKVDADLRPALRESDLVIVPVAASHVDVWATESVLDLARRERRPVLVLLNRAKAGTRLLAEVETAIADLGAARSAGSFGNRIAYAEALGTGHGVMERARGPWTAEVDALVDEIEALLSAG